MYLTRDRDVSVHELFLNTQTLCSNYLLRYDHGLISMPPLNSSSTNCKGVNIMTTTSFPFAGLVQ